MISKAAIDGTNIGAYQDPIQTPTPIPSESPYPSTSPNLQADADNDQDVDLDDLTVWFNNFLNIIIGKQTGDFNSDGKTNLFDFGIWIIESLTF